MARADTGGPHGRVSEEWYILYCGRGRGEGKKWLDLRYVLKIKLVGLANG